MMASAIHNGLTPQAHTERTSAQCCFDDRNGGPSPVEAVALLVGSAVFGLLFFGPVGMIICPTATLVGLFIVILISNDQIKVTHTYRSTPRYSPPPSRFSFGSLWDTTPVTPHRPTAIYVASPSTYQRQPTTPPSGAHFGRGHMNTQPAPQYETPSTGGGHFGRGHMKT